MNNQLSLEDARKAQKQLASQFNAIGRSLVLSNNETGELFLEQKESEIIPREVLHVVKSVLLGKPIVPIEVYRDMAAGSLKKFQSCPVIHVLHKMTNGNLMPELVQHSLKMTAVVVAN